MPSEMADNMIRRQVHTWEVMDHDILQLMARVRRDAYVAEAYQGVAFSEGEILAANGTVLRPAREIGRILEVLGVAKTESVALIGAESGYLVALLSQLGHHVTWILPVGHDKGVAAVANDLGNVTCASADLLSGWQQDGPFDAVIVMGAMPTLPQSFLDVLTQGGRLFTVLGQTELVMTAWLVTRTEQGDWHRRSLFEVRWPWLLDKAPGESFSF